MKPPSFAPPLMAFAEPAAREMVFALPGSFVDDIVNLVTERVLDALPANSPDEWMDSREAADYLRISLDGLHRHTAERSIPFEQSHRGAKCYFKRSALDEWRHMGEQMDAVALRDGPILTRTGRP